jgi:urease accessory protein
LVLRAPPGDGEEGVTMLDAAPPCADRADAPPSHQRTRGAGRCTFKLRDGRTTLSRLRQSGAMKVRLPFCRGRAAPEAVLINTAGGLTGGDVLDFEGAAETGAHAVFTSQASERAYRSVTGPAEIHVRLSAAAGARIDWLPQETIVFDRADLSRTLDVDLAADAVLLAHESVVFGRTAMGETVRRGRFRDRWRVRRDGRLIHADALRIDGAVEAVLNRAACLNGACAMATILLAAPGVGAAHESIQDQILAVPSERGLAGVSTWNDKLVVRAAATDGRDLRRIVEPLLSTLMDGRALPRVWML